MQLPIAFKGKTAFVTGGGTGLGLEIARRLGRAGAAVACASRDPGHHRALLEDGQRMEYAVESIELDVRDPGAVRAAVEGAAARFGSLDLLVNNAAGNFIRPSLKLAPKGWQAVIDIALSGVFYCSQAAGRIMVEQGSGVILNVSAPYTTRGMPGVVHSVCAKAGVEAMTRTLAAEWGPLGLRVVAISPGPFGTEGARTRLWPTPEIEEGIRAQIPLGRFASAGEVADAAIWLLSSEARYCNGTVLAIDGGWLLGGGGMPPDLVRRERDGGPG